MLSKSNTWHSRVKQANKFIRMAFSVDKVQNQTGFLIINEEGGIISSGGDLEYNENFASIFYQMVKGIDKGILSLSDNESGFKKLSINYDDYFYVVVVSNKKIHVVKRKYVPLDPAVA